jgi:hypothetical protein
MATAKSFEASVKLLIAASLANKYVVEEGKEKSFEIYEGSDLVVGRKYWIPSNQVAHQKKFKTFTYSAYFTLDNSGRRGEISSKSFNKTCFKPTLKEVKAEKSQFKSASGNEYWCPATSGQMIRLWSGEAPVMAVKVENGDATVCKDIFFEVVETIKVSEPIEINGQFAWSNKAKQLVKTQKVNKLVYRFISKEEFFK